MLILGIESTCDETGVALVEDGRIIRTNRVLSQVKLHERFGGIVPEIASRAHVESITMVIEAAFEDAGIDLRSAPQTIDGIAVAYRPGLVGSLLIGVTAAKCLALAWDVPLVGVDHIHAHIYAVILGDGSSEGVSGERNDDPILPAISLVVSGGHTALYLTESWTSHTVTSSWPDTSC